MFMSNGGKVEYHRRLLTCSLVVSITRAFGTNNAVLVFLINVTEMTGIAIWRFEEKKSLSLSVKTIERVQP